EQSHRGGTQQAVELRGQTEEPEDEPEADHAGEGGGEERELHSAGELVQHQGQGLLVDDARMDLDDLPGPVHEVGDGSSKASQLGRDGPTGVEVVIEVEAEFVDELDRAVPVVLDVDADELDPIRVGVPGGGE